MRRFSSLRLLLSLLLSWLVVLNSINANAKERVTYYHNDVQGSPVAATNAQGALLWQEDYAPYGKRLIKEGDGRNTRWFTGKSEVAALGLQYFDARWYQADLGRFLSVDPADFDDGDIHTFNRYAYANNNPYRYVDPNGESPLDVGFLIVDLVKLGVAVSSGVGVGAAAADVGLSLVGVISPVPGIGVLAKAEYAAKLAKSVNNVADGARAAKSATGLKRPYLRKSTREAIQNAAPKTADGKFIDPNTGKAIEGPFHYGHTYGHEHRRLKAEAEAKGMTQKEFNNHVNSNPKFFQIEDPASNMGHKFEKPGK